MSRLWPTQSLPTEAVMGPWLWVVGTIVVSDVLLVAACHLALVVTNQGDTCIPGHKGRLLTNLS